MDADRWGKTLISFSEMVKNKGSLQFLYKFYKFIRNCTNFPHIYPV